MQPNTLFKEIDKYKDLCYNSLTYMQNCETMRNKYPVNHHMYNRYDSKLRAEYEEYKRHNAQLTTYVSMLEETNYMLQTIVNKDK